MSARAAQRAVTAALGLVAAVGALHPFIESDVCWHLMLGRAVARHHARTVPEPTALGDFGRAATAPEWLWDLVTWLLHGLGAWTALTFLIMALAVGCVLALRRLVALSEPSASTPAWGLSLSLCAVLGLLRVHERPEASVMVLLPCAMILSHRVVTDADARGARRAAVGLTLLTALWAQLHGSVLLASLVFAARAAPLPWVRTTAPEPASLRLRALTLLATLAASSTGAYGPGVALHVMQHARGDAVRHLIDMSAPTLVYFDPRVSLHGPVYVALWTLSLAGMVSARAVFWRELAWALLGLSLVVTAVRGLGPGGILLAPLATRGIHALFERVPARGRRALGGASLALAVFALGAMLTRVQREQGPIGSVGLRPGYHPHGEARFLRSVPRGTRVLTTVSAGAPLGWWLDGHARTFLDSRIPLYFDDTDFGVLRDLGSDTGAVRRAVARYGFDVAVIERRNRPLCRALLATGEWTPVGVSAGFSTFARRDGPVRAHAIEKLSPCEIDYLTPGACGDDHGTALEAEIQRMRAWADGSFIDYLRAERVVRCGVGGVTVAALLAMVPPPHEAGVYPDQRDGLLASILLNTGDVEASADLVEDRIRAGDVAALAVVAPSLARANPARLRELLDAVTRRLDDGTPPDLRADFAALCASVGDFECARFHGVRAAVRGSPRAVPALCGLVSNARDPAARRDASRWLETLRAEARAGGRPEPSCAPSR